MNCFGLVNLMSSWRGAVVLAAGASLTAMGVTAAACVLAEDRCAAWGDVYGPRMVCGKRAVRAMTTADTCSYVLLDSVALRWAEPLETSQIPDPQAFVRPLHDGLWEVPEGFI